MVDKSGISLFGGFQFLNQFFHLCDILCYSYTVNRFAFVIKNKYGRCTDPHIVTACCHYAKNHITFRPAELEYVGKTLSGNIQVSGIYNRSKMFAYYISFCKTEDIFKFL